jgi:outer membrane translocation and assembly module TamA
MNAELSYEIISHLEIAGFIDAGSISRDDSALFSTDDLRYGVGLGVRYQLPIGPLRMDYGYNPDRHPGEAAGAFHLTFGFAF